MTDINAEFTEFKAPAHLEAIRQEHEAFLTKLEALAVLAIASGDWTQFEQFVNDFRASHQDVETTPSEGTLAELWLIAFPKEPS